ncbi:hypothetical protein HMH01_14605 [Halovulum dunhuangense]|uniref:Uncharacterized protein n=1 Tax=Halovulum dunhuangense TaxID=1505036 RepID=A0A849L5D5_9RHOB|nr:hypothetical protein [Halovulum dunhuangense]NNU81668.1 hypothetical protein [Halovulum dunhuangense]
MAPAISTARKLHDFAPGDIRRLQDGLSDGEAFSLASAVEWREAILAARKKAQEEGGPFNGGVEFVLTDKLEQAATRRFNRPAQAFCPRGYWAGYPPDLAHAQYVEACCAGYPCGYARSIRRSPGRWARRSCHDRD